jgi:hypothetical protein
MLAAAVFFKKRLVRDIKAIFGEIGCRCHFLTFALYILCEEFL